MVDRLHTPNLEEMFMENSSPRVEPAPDSSRRPYEAPQVTVMDEKEVLKVFQITSAGTSWWG
jgi:hypothetical protein